MTENAAVPAEGQAPRQETKAERRERVQREGRAMLVARGKEAHSLVLQAQEKMREHEGAARRRGQAVIYPYSEDKAREILRHVERAVPIADYSEYPGAPEHPGVGSLVEVPDYVIQEWIGDRHQGRKYEVDGVSFGQAVARARESAADRLADKMLRLADTALMMPGAANAVRVAADILRWQSAWRNRARYGDQTEVKHSNNQVTINIGSAPKGRLIEHEPTQSQHSDTVQALNSPSGPSP